MSQPPDFDQRSRSASRRETSTLVLGSLVAAGAAYAFLQIGARVLGPEKFAPISTLWTLQFLVLAVALMPIEQLATRSRALGIRPPIRTAWVVGLTSAGVSMVFAFAMRDSLYSGISVFVVLTPIAILTTAVYAFGRGLLAGDERYARYGQVTGGQSLLRLAVGAPLLVITAQATMGGWAIALAPLVVVAWRPFRAMSSGQRASGSEATAFVSGLFVGNGFAQVILLAGPLLVGWLDGDASAVSLTFVVLTLFRAPVAVAAEILTRLVPPFSKMAETGQFRRLRTVGMWIVVTGAMATAVAAVLASWIGIPLTVFLFGADYRPDQAIVVWVAVGSVLATVGLTLNQILVGLGRTWLIAGAWAGGFLAASLTLMLVGTDVVERVVISFAAGEAVATIALVIAIVVATTRPSVTTP